LDYCDSLPPAATESPPTTSNGAAAAAKQINAKVSAKLAKVSRLVDQDIANLPSTEFEVFSSSQIQHSVIQNNTVKVVEANIAESSHQDRVSDVTGAASRNATLFDTPVTGSSSSSSSSSSDPVSTVIPARAAARLVAESSHESSIGISRNSRNSSSLHDNGNSQAKAVIVGTVGSHALVSTTTTLSSSSDQLFRPTVLSRAMSTPRHTMMPLPLHAQQQSRSLTPHSAAASGHSSTLSAGGLSNTVRYNVPDVAPVDRLLSLERSLGYNGGAAVLLASGSLLLFASGPLLVLVDLTSTGLGASSGGGKSGGFWRAFSNVRSGGPLGTSCGSPEDKTGDGGEGMDRCGTTAMGYRQAFLRGHSSAIGIIEVGNSKRFLA
jgi:hypothetical protein